MDLYTILNDKNWAEKLGLKDKCSVTIYLNDTEKELLDKIIDC